MHENTSVGRVKYIPLVMFISLTRDVHYSMNNLWFDKHSTSATICLHYAMYSLVPWLMYSFIIHMLLLKALYLLVSAFSSLVLSSSVKNFLFGYGITMLSNTLHVGTAREGTGGDNYLHGKLQHIDNIIVKLSTLCNIVHIIIHQGFI